MGFKKQWCDWILECVSSARVAVLVNGSPTSEFNLGRGLRQGDPLSPFLFNIATEALSRFLEKAAVIGLFKGFEFGGHQLTHLQYVDDVLLFCDGDSSELLNLKRVLRVFELLAGLKINFHKSALIGMNQPDIVVDEMANLLACKSKKMPFKYLGIFIGENPRRKLVWRDVTARFQSKLAMWKGKFLSLGGRITLIKAVLNSIPMFIMSICQLGLERSWRLGCEDLYGRAMWRKRVCIRLAGQLLV